MSDTIEAIPVNEAEEGIENNIAEDKQTIPVEEAIDKATQPQTEEQQATTLRPEGKPKAKRGCRPKGSGKGLNLRDKKACVDCGKTFSVHTLTYSHDAYCPAKKEKRKTEEIIRQHIGPQSFGINRPNYFVEDQTRVSLPPEQQIIYKPRELNEDEEKQVYHNYIVKMKEKMEAEKRDKYKKLISFCINK